MERNMYKAAYNINSERRSAVLRVVFNFGRNFAREDRLEIKRRIDLEAEKSELLEYMHKDN